MDAPINLPETQKPDAFPAYVRWIEVGSFILGTCFWLDMGYWCWLALNAKPLGWAEWLAVLLTTPLAMLAADFMSGLVHYTFDNFGNEQTPILGPTFIKPFRDHHVYPKGITEHGFLATVGLTAIGAVPVSLFMLWLLPTAAQATTFHICLMLFVMMFVFFGVMTNQIHQWAHVDVAPRWVQRLQRAGIILSAKAHAYHHAPPHDGHYCITTGWLNRLW
jgi:hypothetical protein